MSGGWSVDAVSGLAVLRCAPLDDLGPFRHAVSTRRGPDGNPFDLTRATDGGGPSAEARRGRLLEAAGLGGARLVEVAQVHGADVVAARDVDDGTRADAVWLSGDDDGVAVGVRIADCVPILVVDPDGRAAAAIHAGWRGVAAGVVAATLDRLARAGVPTERLHAGIGPAIGPCCYRVGADCADRIVRAVPDVDRGVRPVVDRRDGPRIDLPEAVRRQLRGAGVPSERIHRAPWCTRCSPDLLFSHRGEAGRAGRMLAVVGLPAAAGRP